MKLSCLLAFLCAASVSHGSLVVSSYESGVAPTSGTTGAADPTSQGWSTAGAVTAFSHGQDSTNGGWRITDGTSGAAFFYQQAISTPNAALMAGSGWSATWTSAVNADAVQDTGVPNGVDNYYSGSPGLQFNNAMWIEVAGSFRYILSHRTDSNGDIFLNDGTNSFQITNTTGNLSQELGAGAPAVTYVSYSLIYDVSTGTASLTDSLGGVHGTVAPSGVAGTDRVVWGATSSSTQGSTTWNSVSVVAVPEASEVALLALGGLGLAFFRRRGRK